MQYSYFFTIFIILSNNVIIVLDTYGDNYRFSVYAVVLILSFVLYVYSVYMTYRKRPKMIFKVS